MKKRIEPIAGFPKKWSDLILKSGILNAELGGLTLAGEDLKNNCIWIAINDLPDWIKAGVNFKLKMSEADIKLLKEYFKNL